MLTSLILYPCGCETFIVGTSASNKIIAADVVAFKFSF